MFFNEKELDISHQETDLDVFKRLLLKKDKLKKDEMIIYNEYVVTFGKLLEQCFSLQIECIKYKKIISVCQSKKNRGEDVIVLAPIEEEVNKELTSYYEELQLINAISSSEISQVLSYQYMLIKKKYKQIAMSIHPDLHSEYANDCNLINLWEQAKAAYKFNNLDKLEEVEFLVAEHLKNYGKEPSIDIKNIKEKISKVEREIDYIVSHEPYKFKLILDDPLAIESKKEQLKSDIERYEVYLDELLEKLNEFNIIKELLI